MGVLFKNNRSYSGGKLLMSPECYSTEEREVGCWTDGKPLYQKTITIPSFSSSSPISIDVSALNIDKMPYAVGEAYAISNGAITETLLFPGYISSSYYAAIRYVNSSNVVQILHNHLNEYTNGIITIQYTKTTDIAGSGVWTPSGVPAVHYSTTEHVVGTWIDRSPVYEKVYEFSSTFTMANGNQWYNTSFSRGDIDLLIDVVGVESGGMIYSGLIAGFDSGYISLLNYRYTDLNAFIVRYTKSS